MNRLEQAEMLLREALITLREIRYKAGDVHEWREGGSYSTLLEDVKGYLTGYDYDPSQR